MTDSTEIAERDEIDWMARARSTLQVTDTKGTSKLTRRLLANLCESLADGIPMKTASKLCGTAPQSIHDWQKDKPAVAQLIDQARAMGEIRYIKAIQQDTGYKAQAYMLERVNTGYADSHDTTSRNGISISINVPIPGQVEAGQQPMIDVTPVEQTGRLPDNDVDNQ